ncbi:transketolase C-terminal domain-containing protein [Clostridium sp. AM58-1XD]|uniref:transketolase family protein n=1 Tax=Clostridium sp. AM58-1XD TaxID=2292307 RepID=UPI000ECCE9B0|nr:transketolase C-terminal domain-containing protein [Clostridium sp. AM58-1XD]RGY98277.1 transketolase family protein [Clostridium sp. AM58-1XD]
MRNFGEKKDTKTTYGETLADLAEQYPELVVVEADLMKASGSDPVKAKYPERTFNVGIAEQDALGFSAGLAAMGKLPFVSGFACFVAQRACDQAKNSIAYNDFNVKVIGTYAGLTSEKNGGTHISIDDVAIYRSIPRFEVYDPGDANEFAQILRYAAKHKGPVYIRSNKGNVPTFTPEDREFCPGKAELLSEGTDAGLITTGITTAEGIRAVEELKKSGISVAHLHMPSIKPIDREAIAEIAKRTKVIVTVENHTIYGGLGSAVAEVLCEEQPAHLVRLGLQDHFGETAQLSYMMHKYGIDEESIVAEIKKILDK